MIPLVAHLRTLQEAAVNDQHAVQRSRAPGILDWLRRPITRRREADWRQRPPRSWRPASPTPTRTRHPHHRSISSAALRSNSSATLSTTCVTPGIGHCEGRRVLPHIHPSSEVDETKRRGYLLVTGVVVPGDLDSTRRVLRGFVLPGQRRLPIKDENDQRRRSIATAIAVSGVTATVYNAGRHRNERERRAACQHALITDAARRGDARLVLEQDDTLLSWDNQRLIEFTRRPAAGRLCTTSTATPPTNCCSRCRTRSPGAGPRAATGDDASNRSSPTSASCDPPQTSAKPGSPTVRTATGLTS